MNFIRTHKKLSIIVLIIAIILFLYGTTLARYIYNAIHNYILESKEFYFNSTVLDMNTKQFRINNWDGVNDYVLTIDVNNKKNSLKSTPSDISYKIEVSCPDTVECKLSKTEGIIYQTAGTDSYQVTVIPKDNFYEGDEVEVTTTATSTSPYVKSLSATYTIGIETSNFTYDITDAKNDKFLTLNLTNALTYYKVEKSFGAYQEGDRLSTEEYQALTEEEKANCFSAKVTLSIPTREIYLDMTNKNYIKKIAGSEKTETIDNFNYVKEFTFKMDASSSEKVIFYKEDITKDYTYPIVNEESIVTVTVETAE